MVTKESEMQQKVELRHKFFQFDFKASNMLHVQIFPKQTANILKFLSIFFKGFHEIAIILFFLRN